MKKALKRASSRENPLLKPLPLFAMIASTLVTIAVAVVVFVLPLHRQPETLARKNYVCEQCGTPNVFNDTAHKKPVFGTNHSANFNPVIFKVTQGRYRHIIETEHLLLREATKDDIPALTAQISRVENAASATWVQRPEKADAEKEATKEINEIIDNYRRGKSAHWAICEKSTGTFMGLGGFFEYAPLDHRATMGWTLDSKFWGRGYATELGKACVEYGMKFLGLNRIKCIVRVDNAASRRVLEKIGMTPVGLMRQYWRVKGELLSHYRFVICKKDIKEQLKKSKV